jgi:hypothetical protein
MVWSKKDSKGQETGGNHDKRDRSARNCFEGRNQPNKKYYLKYGYPEALNELHNTDYSKYQDSANGREPRDERI